MVDLTLLPDEQILNENQTDIDDFVPCENQDEEAVAMVEEPPSGISITEKILNLVSLNIIFFIYIVPWLSKLDN